MSILCKSEIDTTQLADSLSLSANLPIFLIGQTNAALYLMAWITM